MYGFLKHIVLSLLRYCISRYFYISTMTQSSRESTIRDTASRDVAESTSNPRRVWKNIYSFPETLLGRFSACNIAYDAA